MPDEPTRKDAAASSSTRYRVAVAARLILAAFGSYAVAALSTAVLSLVLPLVRSEAVATATLLSFAIMAGAVVWVFAARTLGRAALGIGLPIGILAAALWLALDHAPAVSPT